jgi:nucleolar complex protein 2
MAKSLADLAKKDPEFFKYLKENDAELLDFEGGDEDEMMEYDAGSGSEEEPEFGEPEEQKEVKKVSVSMKMLRSWQRAMIEVSRGEWRNRVELLGLMMGWTDDSDEQQSSLRSLRKTILAFRAAAHMNQDDEDEIETKYKIDSAQGGFSSRDDTLSRGKS